jgi:hypothetical protein
MRYNGYSTFVKIKYLVISLKLLTIFQLSLECCIFRTFPYNYVMDLMNCLAIQEGVKLFCIIYNFERKFKSDFKTKSLRLILYLTVCLFI